MQNALKGNYRWLICALLFFATTINYIDRQILALLKPVLDEQLHWTNEEFGDIQAAFQGAYAVSLLFFGWFIDRFGTKIGYSVSIAAWSIAALAHAFVSTVGGFFNARIALGLGEGGNFPASIKAVAQWFPKRERALATSIFNSGANVGAIAAPALVPWIALTWGWQAAFIMAGVAGFVWLLLWFPFFHNHPESAASVSKEELEHIRSDSAANETGETRKASWLSLMAYRQTWSFIVAKLLTDPVWWFFLSWLPDYFKKTRGLDIKNSAVLLVAIYGIITVLSIGGGWLTGSLAGRGWTVTRARKSSMFLFAVCVVPILLASSAGNWVAVLLIGLAGAAHQAWSANLFSTVSDMFPKYAVASVVGLGGVAGAVGGIAFQRFTGRLLDHFTAQGSVTEGYAVLFSICAFAYIVAFGVHHLLAPRFDSVQLKVSGGKDARS